MAERGLALKTDDPALYLVAIKAHQDSNDHEAALKVAGQMVRKFPDLARANFEYAYELNRTGRPDEAEPFLKKAIAADPNYEEPFFCRARSYRAHHGGKRRSRPSGARLSSGATISLLGLRLDER